MFAIRESHATYTPGTVSVSSNGKISGNGPLGTMRWSTGMSVPLAFRYPILYYKKVPRN